MIDHWCRHVMNEKVLEKVSNLNPSGASVLEISGTEWESFDFKAYENVQFPDFDICKQAKNKKYDIIFAEQVFEHIEDPVSAAKNILKMLNKNGTAIITTPFLIKFHPSPHDFWRWTKEGLKVFLKQQGFSNVEVASWGNRDCVIGNLYSWPYYDANVHSLVNEEEYPIVVWAFAKK